MRAEIALARRLAFAYLVTNQIAQPFVRGVLVRLTERGVVEDLFDELVDGSIVVENHHSDVNQFGSALAYDAHSEKFLVGAREDEFQHSGSVAGDVATGIVGIESAPDTVVDLFLF